MVVKIIVTFLIVTITRSVEEKYKKNQEAKKEDRNNTKLIFMKLYY